AEKDVRRNRIDDDIELLALAPEHDRFPLDVVVLDDGGKMDACFSRAEIEVRVVTIGSVRISGDCTVPSRSRTFLYRDSLRRPVEGIESPIVLDLPHLLVVSLDHLFVEGLTDGADPVFLEVFRILDTHGRSNFPFDDLSIGHPCNVVPVDGIIIE